MSPPKKFENGKLYGAAMRSETNHCVYDWILLRFLQIQSDFNRFQKDWILTWESENGRWWQLQSSEVKKRKKKKENSPRELSEERATRQAATATEEQLF